MPATAACAGTTAAGASVLATTATSAAPATRAIRRRRGRSAGARLVNEAGVVLQVDEAGVVLAAARRDRSPLDWGGRPRPGAAVWVGIGTELPPLSGHGGIWRHGGVRRWAPAWTAGSEMAGCLPSSHAELEWINPLVDPSTQRQRAESMKTRTVVTTDHVGPQDWGVAPLASGRGHRPP